jgi:hypothetical protein
LALQISTGIARIRAVFFAFPAVCDRIRALERADLRRSNPNKALNPLLN